MRLSHSSGESEMGTMNATGSSVGKELALLAVLSLCTALPAQAQVKLTPGPEQIARNRWQAVHGFLHQRQGSQQTLSSSIAFGLRQGGQPLVSCRPTAPGDDGSSAPRGPLLRAWRCEWLQLLGHPERCDTCFEGRRDDGAHRLETGC